MDLYRQNTPIEEYDLRGYKVYVKRDDLFGKPPAPPLGKLRGLRVIIRDHYENGCRLVGCWDTRVSKLGEGLAAAAQYYPDLAVVIAYPTKRSEPVPPQIIKSERLGAEIYAIRGNVTPICFRQASKYVHSKGGVMLPFGLESEAAVAAIAKEASRIPTKLTRGGTLVLCSGSGVTLTGILRGLKVLPDNIIAMSSGRAVANIRACVKRFIEQMPPQLEILPAQRQYYDQSDSSCPFPCHPNYDLKVWEMLERNIEKYQPPILFWNIGA